MRGAKNDSVVKHNKKHGRKNNGIDVETTGMREAGGVTRLGKQRVHGLFLLVDAPRGVDFTCI